jgi:hypothetical protein
MRLYKNYTVIHGNVIYKVTDAVYDSTATHRTFRNKDGDLVLSVPLSSVLVSEGYCQRPN